MKIVVCVYGKITPEKLTRNNKLNEMLVIIKKKLKRYTGRYGKFNITPICLL